MSIVTRVQPIERDIALLIDETASPEAASRLIASTARAALADAQQKNTAALGHAPDFERTVDGRRNAPEETVRPDGVIVYAFDVGLQGDVVDWCWQEVLRRAPVRSGRFAASQVLYADGMPVETPDPTLQAQEWVILSTEPYARKIERGQSAQAPDGLYEAIATLAQRRFGNIARVRFGYRVPVGGVTGLERWASGRKRRNRRDAERDRRQPAIVITPR